MANSANTTILKVEAGNGRLVTVDYLANGETGDVTSNTLQLEVTAKGFGSGELLLHWGIGVQGPTEWVLPAGMQAVSDPPANNVPGALQTAFPEDPAGNSRKIEIQIEGLGKVKGLQFVLVKKSNEWIKNGKGNFLVDLTSLERKIRFQSMVQSIVPKDKSLGACQTWNTPDVQICIVAAPGEHVCQIQVKAMAQSSNELVLQYGLAGTNRKWKASSRVRLTESQNSMIEATVEIPGGEMDAFFMFVLHEPAPNRWLKDGGQDFAFELPQRSEWSSAKLEMIAKKESAKLEMEAKKAQDLSAADTNRKKFLSGRSSREKQADVWFGAFKLERDCGDLDVVCRSSKDGNEAVVEITAFLNPRLGPCLLHWGVFSGKRKPWECPNKKGLKLPADTVMVDEKASQTKLQPSADQVHGVEFSVPMHLQDDKMTPTIAGFAFVLKTANGNEWFKNCDQKDCVVSFAVEKGQWKGDWASLAAYIVETECEWSHMTLMHRYNNCRGKIEEWQQKQEEPIRVTRLPSWDSLVRIESGPSIWSRMPSMPLLGSPAEEHVTDEEFWSWIFVWQRFSFMKLLDWERNWCTQPRQLAGAIDSLRQKLADTWKKHPGNRQWIRWTLATMGRGGNAGQAIRDEILHIMHGHKISEQSGHFYEQWHQKLHNNTTPEDVGICKALLAFLRDGGNMNTYWKVLQEHNISRERLASYSRPITKEPYLIGDTNALIGRFEHYLGTLQSVHDALDLKTAINHAKCLPGDVRNRLQEIAAMGGVTGDHDADHSKFMRVSEVRKDLLAMLNNKNTDTAAVTEFLLLDYTLETQQSVYIQGMTNESRLVQLNDQLKALLTSLVGHMPLEEELQAILADLSSLAPDCAALKWNGPVESALLLKSMVDRVSRVVGDLADTAQNLMGSKSAFLGEAIGAPKKILEIFVDEVLRGTSLLSVSLILQRMEPVLRGLAHLPPWQLISTVDHPVQGEFLLIDKMTNIQDKVFTTPTILLSGAVSGEEEVPEGVCAVLVRSAKEAPDILSHCAVRARNFGVLLATCFDPNLSAKLAADFEGKWVEVSCKADGTLNVVAAKRVTTPEASSGKDASTLESAVDSKGSNTKNTQDKVLMNLTNDMSCSWVVRPDEMDNKSVGSKSLNLALLRPKLPPQILTPQAVALPYGCMQKALTHNDNANSVLPKLQDVLQQLQPDTSNTAAQVIFTQAQEFIQDMAMPAELREALSKAMDEVGAKDGEARLKQVFNPSQAWDAIKSVWASLFALRPWVSLAKAGRSFHDLNMAVLVQDIVAAKYAFVLHTVNPFTHDPNELYGEVVAGRGEVLVGNFPGRALSFAMRKGEEPRLIAFMSKSVQLRTQNCLIFRSDSNGEDLEGFAGAGLFESICAQEDLPGHVRLHRLPIITDRNYRQKLLTRIAEAGWAAQDGFGGAPQDIEGCVDPDDRLIIVQSRPQV